MHGLAPDCCPFSSLCYFDSMRSSTHVSTHNARLRTEPRTCSRLPSSSPLSPHPLPDAHTCTVALRLRGGARCHVVWFCAAQQGGG